MKSEKMFILLKELGFILPDEFDGDIYQPNYQLFNHDNTYLGDVLISHGFTKHKEIVNQGKSWITFKKDGEVSFGHRDLEEYKTNTFFVDEHN